MISPSSVDGYRMELMGYFTSREKELLEVACTLGVSSGPLESSPVLQSPSVIPGEGGGSGEESNQPLHQTGARFAGLAGERQTR